MEQVIQDNGQQTPATLWYRKSKAEDGSEFWDFNHLEDGHVPDGAKYPTPKHENHKSAWKRGEWRAEKVYLTAEKPPKVIRP